MSYLASIYSDTQWSHGVRVNGPRATLPQNPPYYNGTPRKLISATPFYDTTRRVTSLEGVGETGTQLKTAGRTLLTGAVALVLPFAAALMVAKVVGPRYAVIGLVGGIAGSFYLMLYNSARVAQSAGV